MRSPVVVLLHGFGAEDAEPYAAWIDHLAASGCVIVYPVYPALEASRARTRHDAMWAGVRAVVLAGLPAGGAQPDPGRVGVVGHSFGGGAAPAIAARAAARGWGARGLWVLCLAPWYDLDEAAWEALPPATRLLVVTYEDDRMCDPGIGAAFLARARTIPAENKAFLCLRSDEHGRPPLRADHRVPLTLPTPDAFDERATWRLADALRAAAEGDPAGAATALGPGRLDLGAWSDGTPLRAPLDAWPPPSGPPRRAMRMWRPGGTQEETMRRILMPEAHSALGLPPRSEARASRLPASERLLAPPPSGPWPPGVAAALAKGPVLVLSPDAPAALDARLRDLPVPVVRLPADAAPAVAKAFEAAGTPTALLLARGGAARLWQAASDPNLREAVEDLARP